MSPHLTYTQPLSRRRFLQAGALSTIAMTPLAAYAKRSSLRREWPNSGPNPLEGAVKAVHWIRSAQMDTAKGRYWLAEPDHPGKETSACQLNGICGGGAGIVLFFLQMAHATGESSYLEDARRGADYLVSVWPDLLKSETEPANLSFYHGVAGVAFALSETGKAASEPRYQQAAHAATDALVRSAQPIDDACTVLYLLHAARSLKDERYRGAAIKAGLHLADLGRPQADGGLEWRETDTKSRAAGTPCSFCGGGTADVAFTLARLFEEEPDDRFLDAAIRGDLHLQNVTGASGSRDLISYSSANALSTSHPEFGAAISGRARLLYQLYKVTGMDCYLARTETLARAAIDAEQTVRHKPGAWETVRQSSGTASLLDLLLDLSVTLGKVEYAETAASLASAIVEQNTDFDGSGYRWDQRFPWIIPSAISAQTGYLTGAAGIGAALVHVALAQRGDRQPIVFPDNPFFGACDVRLADRSAAS